MRDTQREFARFFDVRRALVGRIADKKNFRHRFVIDGAVPRDGRQIVMGAFCGDTDKRTVIYQAVRFFRTDTGLFHNGSISPVRRIRKKAIYRPAEYGRGRSRTFGRNTRIRIYFVPDRNLTVSPQTVIMRKTGNLPVRRNFRRM